MYPDETKRWNNATVEQIAENRLLVRLVSSNRLNRSRWDLILWYVWPSYVNIKIIVLTVRS